MNNNMNTVMTIVLMIIVVVAVGFLVQTVFFITKAVGRLGETEVETALLRKDLVRLEERLGLVQMMAWRANRPVTKEEADAVWNAPGVVEDEISTMSVQLLRTPVEKQEESIPAVETDSGGSTITEEAAAVVKPAYKMTIEEFSAIPIPGARKDYIRPKEVIERID